MLAPKRTDCLFSTFSGAANAAQPMDAFWQFDQNAVGQRVVSGCRPWLLPMHPTTQAHRAERGDILRRGRFLEDHCLLFRSLPCPFSSLQCVRERYLLVKTASRPLELRFRN